MNNKGQALVEFVLLIPVIVLLLLAVIDFGLLFHEKMKLENNLNDILILEVTEMETYAKKNNIEIKKEEKEITIKKEFNFKTPGLNKLIENPYYIETSGVVYE